MPIGALVAQPRQREIFIAMVLDFMPLLGPANPMSYDTGQVYIRRWPWLQASAPRHPFALLPALSPALRTRRLLALTLRDLRRVIDNFVLLIAGGALAVALLG